MVTSRTSQPREVIDPEFLLAAYAAGYFPMAESREGPIGWLSPDPRGVLPLDAFVISRSLRQTVKKKLYTIQMNTSFEEVMRLCSRRAETWISEEIVQSYVGLHKRGYAHSVESWKAGRLAGGLYGVALGGAFFGESMFSVERDASKVALVWLVERLRDRGFELLDTQFITPHLASFGAVEIPRNDYLRRLTRAIQLRCRFSD